MLSDKEILDNIYNRTFSLLETLKIIFCVKDNIIHINDKCINLKKIEYSLYYLTADYYYYRHAVVSSNKTTYKDFSPNLGGPDANVLYITIKMDDIIKEYECGSFTEYNLLGALYENPFNFDLNNNYLEIIIRVNKLFNKNNFFCHCLRLWGFDFVGLDYCSGDEYSVYCKDISQILKLTYDTKVSQIIKINNKNIYILFIHGVSDALFFLDKNDEDLVDNKKIFIDGYQMRFFRDKFFFASFPPVRKLFDELEISKKIFVKKLMSLYQIINKDIFAEIARLFFITSYGPECRFL